MIIQFLILGIGLLFANRTLKNKINRKPLAEAILHRLKKRQTTIFLILTILSTCLHPLIILFLIFILIFSIHHIDKWINFVLRQNFQQLWAQFLDELILLMMTGRSFRDAFLFLTTNSQNIFYLKLREILFRSDFSKNGFTQSSVLNKNTSFFSKKTNVAIIYELVQSIEKNPHKAIEKLKAHRRQVRWILSFRKKSKQITLQLRTQALILSLLYIGLLIFVLNHQMNSKITFSIYSPLVISIGLFIFGILLLFIIGRKKSWKT